MDTCPQCNTQLPENSQFCPRCGTPTSGSSELLASSASDPTGLLDRLRAATVGEFVIVRELGRGGMGRVYLAHEVALDRRVALKVLPPAFSEHAEIVQRFQREARTAGKLSHPYIVSVYQVSERGGLYFFTMPYIEGPSLRQILRQTPQLSVELCRRYLCEAADALSYAHGQGVIHRDIKPENMLLEGDRNGRLLLTDFGIAKALGAATTLTRPGDMMGTPYYMSPELCVEAERIDARSDQYSLGLVAYEMLVGRFPFSADSLAAIVYKHTHEYPEPLSQVRPDVPEDLVSVIERAIRKRPDERFPTMGDMLEALGAATARTLIVDRTPLTAARREPAGRRWLRPALVSTVLAAVVGLAGLAIWRQWLPLPRPGDAQLAEISVPGDEASPAGAGAALLDSASTVAGDTAGSAGASVGTPEGQREPVRRETGEPTTGPPADATTVARRQQALTAQSRAEEALQQAIDAHADSILSEGFNRSELRLADAQRAFDEEQFAQATVEFNVAAELFGNLAAEARRQLDEAALAGAEPGQEGQPAAGEPSEVTADTAVEGQPGPEAVLTPEQAIDELLESYRLALEAEDTAGLRRDVYPDTVPSDNARVLRVWFEEAEGLSVTLERQPLEVSGDEAVVQVKQVMRHRLASTGERRKHDLALRMIFKRTDEGWRLVRFELRR
jgi:hypothetical protein